MSNGAPGQGYDPNSQQGGNGGSQPAYGGGQQSGGYGSGSQGGYDSGPQGGGYGPPQGGGQQSGGYGAPQSGYGAPQQGGAAGAPVAAAAHSGLVNIAGLGTAKVASIGQRALARIIDQLVYLAVWGLLITIGIAIAGGAAGSGDEGLAGMGVGMLFLLALIGTAFTVLYELVMIAKMGATIGKMVIGLQVVDQRNGGHPGFGSSFIRILIPSLANYICGLGLLVYLSPIFDNSGRGQGWHDSAANDLVISKK